MMYQLNEGDRVRFKAWEEMLEDFGGDDHVINCQCTFTRDMEDYFSQQDVYVIKEKGLSMNRVILEGFEEGFSVEEGMLAPTDSDYVPPKHLALGQNINIEGQFWRKIAGQLNLDVENSQRSLRKAIKNVINLLNLKFTKEIRVTCRPYLEYKAEEVIRAFKGKDKLIISLFSEDELERRTEEYSETATQHGLTVERYSDVILLYGEEGGYLHIIGRDFDRDSFFSAFITIMHDRYFPDADPEVIGALLNFDLNTAVALVRDKVDELEKEYEKVKFNTFVQSLQGRMVESREELMRQQIAEKKEEIQGKERRVTELYNNLKQLQKEMVYLRTGDISTCIADFSRVLEGDFENISAYDMVGEGELYIVIKTPLLYFEEDEWERVRKGTFDYCGTKINMRVLDAIFHKEALLTIESGVRINFRNAAIHNHDPQGQTCGMHNPHMYHYDCWGDNKTLIRRALNENDYVRAYIQIKSALAGINLVDAPVMEKFARGLNDYDGIKCITDRSSGMVMTVKEAGEFYLKKDAEEEEKAKAEKTKGEEEA